MKIALICLGLIAAAIVLASAVGSYLFARRAAALADRLQNAPAPVDASARLPEKIRDFAVRSGARTDDLAISVAFSQSVEMLLKPGQDWQPMQARHAACVGTVGFVWQAQQMIGPLPKLQVIDAFVDGVGRLRARLLGLVGVANATGPEIDRDEALRYLAELPWVPDAILGNPAIRWRMLDDNRAEATLDVAGDTATVRFRLDSAGDIVEVAADSRSATDDAGNPTDYPWQGYFRDYRMIGPRRVPYEGEVGYLRPTGYRAYFQGRILDYTTFH